MPNRLSHFWKELIRRKVINVLFMYAGAAIVIIGLASDVAGPFNLPEGAQRLIIIVAIIGFVIAMIFAWIFDITPEGIERTTSMQHSKGNTAQPSNPYSKFKGSIAVLPFKDMSPDKDRNISVQVSLKKSSIPLHTSKA